MVNSPNPNQDPLPLSEAADSITADIQDTVLRSHLNSVVRPKIARLALSGEISPDEVDTLFAAKKARRAELTAPKELQVSVEPPIDSGAEKLWSPSDILDTMPATRELDARERQLPTGDR